MARLGSISNPSCSKAITPKRGGSFGPAKITRDAPTWPMRRRNATPYCRRTLRPSARSYPPPPTLDHKALAGFRDPPSQQEPVSRYDADAPAVDRALPLLIPRDDVPLV